jgi:MFS family permease
VTHGRALALYACAFAVGAVVMGFEMIASRYLYPYFGGGIGTWAGLISTVLFALAAGYFFGGRLVDTWPSARLLVISTAVAALYLALIPVAADQLLQATMRHAGDGPGAILLASAALLIVPLTFLGALSPIIVRLMAPPTTEIGRVSGIVYAVSTVGNVIGTLGTTFILIPTIGSRAITYAFAALLGLVALACTLLRSRAAA